MLELRGQHWLLYRGENSVQYPGDPTVHSDQSSAGPGDHYHEYHYSLQGISVGKQPPGSRLTQILSSRQSGKLNSR